MKNSIFLLFLLLSFFDAKTQKMETITHREINLHQTDSSIKTSVLIEEKKIKVHTLTNYYWYHNNHISTNQGGYSGKLLDGTYQVTSLKGHLITKGKFKKGKKQGLWKKWDEKGALLSIYQWKNGVKNGTYKHYKDGQLIALGSYKNNKQHGKYQQFNQGKVIEKGYYKKGLLHGKQITYDNNTLASKTSYKEGEKVMPKTKQIKEEKQPGISTNEKQEVANKKKWQFWKKGAVASKKEKEEKPAKQKEEKQTTKTKKNQATTPEKKDKKTKDKKVKEKTIEKK